LCKNNEYNTTDDLHAHHICQWQVSRRLQLYCYYRKNML